MQDEITFDWSPRLVGAAARQFALRQTRWHGVAFLATLALAAAWFRVSGPAFWLLLAAPVLYVGAWLNYVRNAVQTAKQLPDHRITVRWDADTITFTSPDHTSTLKWTRVKEIWRFREVWLMFPYGRHTYVLVPTESLLPDSRRFIENHVRQHGGRVV